MCRLRNGGHLSRPQCVDTWHLKASTIWPTFRSHVEMYIPERRCLYFDSDFNESSSSHFRNCDYSAMLFFVFDIYSDNLESLFMAICWFYNQNPRFCASHTWAILRCGTIIIHQIPTLYPAISVFAFRVGSHDRHNGAGTKWLTFCKTTISNVLSHANIAVFWFQFHWNLFAIVQLPIGHRWCKNRWRQNNRQAIIRTNTGLV